MEFLGKKTSITSHNMGVRRGSKIIKSVHRAKTTDLRKLGGYIRITMDLDKTSAFLARKMALSRPVAIRKEVLASDARLLHWGDADDGGVINWQFIRWI